MPYIKDIKRKLVENFIEWKRIMRMFCNPELRNAGVLNYVITYIIWQFVLATQREEGKVSYETHNTIIGVLESVKQEYYRKIIVRYEEQKKKENGEVYLDS